MVYLVGTVKLSFKIVYDFPKYRRENNLECWEVIKLRVFFRKLLRLYVPECRFECDKADDQTLNFCGAVDDKRAYVCTMTKNHIGNHVACGTEEHEIKIWR